MSEEIKEIPLKERIEKLLESGWVNEFNYLESQLQEARYLVVILQQKVEQLEKDNKRLKEWKEDLLSENIELENIRKEATEYLEYQLSQMDFEKDAKAKMLGAMTIVLLNKGSEE